MNDCVNYKEEFEKAAATIPILEKKIDALNKEIESYQVTLKERESEVNRYFNENLRLKEAIVNKFLGIDLRGDKDV